MLQWIGYVFFRLLVFFIGFLPFSILSGLSSGLYGLLYYLFAYRKKVVNANLSLAFPSKSATEVKGLSKAFYRQFAQVIVETLKGLSMTEAQFRKRYIFRNADIFEEYYQNQSSAIIAGGHFGNWEWGSFSFPLWVSANVVGIYKPLNNPHIERFLSSKRCRFGLQVSNMAQAGRALIRQKNQPTLFVFIADQSPSNLEAAHWLSFFGKETPFLQGLDKIARRTGYPVYYYDIQRTRSGHYEITFLPLCLDPKTSSEGAITALYRDQLEKSIRQQPEAWLWSHRRWKRARGVARGQ